MAEWLRLPDVPVMVRLVVPTGVLRGRQPAATTSKSTAAASPSTIRCRRCTDTTHTRKIASTETRNRRRDGGSGAAGAETDPFANTSVTM